MEASVVVVSGLSCWALLTFLKMFERLQTMNKIDFTDLNLLLGWQFANRYTCGWCDVVTLCHVPRSGKLVG